MPRKVSSSLLGIIIASCIGGVGGLDKEKSSFLFHFMYSRQKLCSCSLTRFALLDLIIIYSFIDLTDSQTIERQD